MRVVAGAAKGIQLKTPEGMLTRPTADRVKEAMFSIIQFDLPGARVLDLFGGTGQLGIEALSRGAQSATFVDAREDACRLIKENLKKAKMENSGRVVRSDYRDYLNRCQEKYDIIILDPPYIEDFIENSLNLISEIDILQTNGIIVTERPLDKEIPSAFADFSRSKDYKYGKTLVAIYRREG